MSKIINRKIQQLADGFLFPGETIKTYLSVDKNSIEAKKQIFYTFVNNLKPKDLSFIAIHIKTYITDNNLGNLFSTKAIINKPNINTSQVGTSLAITGTCSSIGYLPDYSHITSSMYVNIFVNLLNENQIKDKDFELIYYIAKYRTRNFYSTKPAESNSRKVLVELIFLSD